MRRRIPILVLAALAVALAGPALAEELSVLDVIRGASVASQTTVVADVPCQDQICVWVAGVPGNPAHFACGAQNNCKCDPADPPVTCANGVCRQPKTGTQAEAGEL